MDVLITITACIGILLVWVMLYDSNRFVVKDYTVTDKRIQKEVRAVVLTDLHNKKYGRKNEKLLAAIREQKPDMILIAGDILTASPGKPLEPAIEFLGELAKECPIYYGNGNHEHRLKLYPETYGDMGERYGQALQDLGIEPLVNTHCILQDCGIAVYGAEIDRSYYKRFQVPHMSDEYMESILGQPDRKLYTVLLAHNPDFFPQYAAWGADLILSGHVHGGVARIPFWGKGVISPGLRLFPKYDGGVFREGQATMILSRGLGMHTIPVRVFNPAELWVVELTPSN